MRSRSPIALEQRTAVSSSGPRSASSSTACCRWRELAAVAQRACSQRRSRRLPIAVAQRSIEPRERVLVAPLRKLDVELEVAARRGVHEHRFARAARGAARAGAASAASACPRVCEQRAGGADRERRVVDAEAAQDRACRIASQSCAAPQSGIEVPRRPTRAAPGTPRATAGGSASSASSSSAGSSRSSSACSASAPSSFACTLKRPPARSSHARPNCRGVAASAPRAAGVSRRSSSSASSVTVPGVTTRTTSRSTGPLLVAGSPICSQIATDSPSCTSSREIGLDRMHGHARHRDSNTTEPVDAAASALRIAKTPTHIAIARAKSLSCTTASSRTTFLSRKS